MKVLAETVSAELTSIGQLRRALRDALQARGMDARTTNDAQLLLAEMATNVVDHGVPPATSLDLEIVIEGRIITLTLTDDGGPFSDFEKRLAGPALSEAPTLGERGLGFKLIRDLARELRYEPGPPNRLQASYVMSSEHPPQT